MRIRIGKHGSMDEASLNHGIRSGYTSGGMEHQWKPELLVKDVSERLAI